MELYGNDTFGGLDKIHSNLGKYHFFFLQLNSFIILTCDVNFDFAINSNVKLIHFTKSCQNIGCTHK